MIIDAGNANFHDTRRRAAEAEAAGSPYLGIGVSGGEEGARHGPSIMGGGPQRRLGPGRADPRGDRGEVRRHPLRHLDGHRRRRALRQDRAQRHRVRRHADDRRGLRHHARRARPSRPRRSPSLRGLERRAAEVLPRRDHRHRLPAPPIPPTGRPMSTSSSTAPARRAPAAGRRSRRSTSARRRRTIEAAVAARNLSARLDERADGRRALPPAPSASAGDGDAALDRARGGAARRQDRLLRPGLRPARRGVAGVRLVAAARRRSPGSGAPAASSARRCSTTWRRRSRASADANLMFAPRFAERLRARHGSLRAVVAAGRARRHPDPGAGGRRSATST